MKPQSLEFGQQLSSCFDGKMTTSTDSAGKKRRPGVIEGSGGSEAKRRKMDPTMTKQCSALLKQPAAGRVFNPKTTMNKKKNRMDLDLGRTRCKLAKYTYNGVEEFAADIKLMVLNVMRCNPPSTSVHKLAQEVNEFFEGRWKSLEDSWNHQQNFKVGHEKILSMPSRQRCSKTGLNKSKPFQEKVVKKAAEVDLPKRKRVGSAAAKTSKLDCQAKSTLMSSLQMSESDIPHSESAVAVSALDDENVCVSSPYTTPATGATSGGEILLTAPIVDAQMSPKKAFRVEMLKSRFADTILKAQQQILLVHGNKANPVKMQQDKEKLERRLREEKAMVEAHIRAADAAAKLKAEVELKKQREKEREASRIALRKMENTAGIELNLEIVKELDILSGYSLSRGNPLHQLGLFLKDEYLEDGSNEAFLYEDVEEGEIVS